MNPTPSEAKGTLTAPALEQLYTRLEGPLYNVVYRWLWHPEDARDTVQEAFVRLWKRRETVDMATVEPLVYKIALNLASNQRRRRKVWRFLTLDVLRTRTTDDAPADSQIAGHQDRAALRRAIDALPEHQRRVLLMCEFAELSYADIAAVLDIPSGTVASRRHHALKALRASMTREDTP